MCAVFHSRSIRINVFPSADDEHGKITRDECKVNILDFQFAMLIQLHKGGIFARLKPTTPSFFKGNKFCLQIEAGTVDNIQVELSAANNFAQVIPELLFRSY